MSRATFSIEIFNDYSRFKNFFSGEREIQEIAQSAKKETPYAPYPYYNRRQVCWIILKAPVDGLITSIFALAGLVSKLCSKSKAHTFEILAEQRLSDLHNLRMHITYKENFLVPSLNMHHLQSNSLYGSSPLRISEIKDRKVEQLTSTSNVLELNFLHDKGVCGGINIWLIYLYLKTDNLFKDPHSHFIAVCKQFEQGAPPQAALIQTFIWSGGMGENVGEKVLGLDLQRKNDTQLYQKSLCNQGIVQKIKALKNGCYAITIRNDKHVITYIKVSDQIGFIHDSDRRGGRALSGKNQAEKLLTELKEISNRETDPVSVYGPFFLKN